ncbi:Heat shock protein HslJ [Nonlabens sp. Hel1_33_55]|uniref:META domain-containing protein n=1 Tax=Nonlabens sp. Hel1_33_55 TaxID=1336802 RepID=UPI000875C467|nr:META domain-containing protein [Nonlabens sp. Hel1_33_55]SCY31726.1 Heat shock protein HslJ [Nonlabens sp. Hel1_33_55]
MKANFLLFGMMILTLVACNELEDINGSYEVITVDGQDMEGQGITVNIQMSEEGNRISGNNGCNEYGGSFENPEANRVEPGMMMSTKMYCVEKAKIEKLYMNQLSQVKKAEYKNNYLKLMDEDGIVLIKAKRIDE